VRHCSPKFVFPVRRLPALLALAFGLSAAPFSAASAAPRVLLLNSYHNGYDWSDDETDGARAVLAKAYPRLELSIEYLDAKRLPGRRHFAQLARLLQEKYRSAAPGLVLTLDNAAFDFARRYRPLLFPHTPLVFCGVNDFKPAAIAGESGVTGVAQNFDSFATLSLALSLHPRTREVVVLNDYTDTGLAMRRELKARAARLSGVRLDFLEEMPLSGALARLKGLSGDCLVLLLSYTSDPDGSTYSQAEVGELVSAASPLPVYATNALQLGTGVVGGQMIDGKLEGQEAARLALRILEGGSAAAPPVVSGGLSRPMFDYAVLSRFGIDPARLPGDAFLVNEPVSSYSVDKTFFWLGLVFTCAITVASAVLYLNVVRRRRLEKALRMTEDKFRQVFNSAADAIYVHDLDGRTLEVNEAACALSGYGREEFLGRRFDLDDPHAAGYHHFQEIGRHGSARYETLQRTAAGFIPVEVSAKAIEYEESPAILSIVRDITRRKAIEVREKTRLQILEEMAKGATLEDLLCYIVRFVEQESPGALCSVLLADEAGERLRLGAAPSLSDAYNRAVDGLRIREGKGSCGTAAFRKKRVIVEDIERHPYWQGFQPAREAGLKACWSEPVLSVEGELFGTFAVYYKSCRSPSPEELGLIGSAANMASLAIGRVRSEELRQKLETQMRQMQKIEAVGQLAAGLAHDFNNLLTPIFVYADVIRRTLDEGDPRLAKLTGIVTCASKAADLTRQLLSFGRKQILAKETLDLNEVIVSLHDLLQRTIRANVEIRTSLLASAPLVLADRGQMEQILVNLAVNAQDAVADSGHILVETADVVLDAEQVRLLPGLKPGAHVLLSFTDDGCGMPPEVLERVFEPFYTTKPAGSGTGLGLATVYGIVKQHGGHVKAVSRLGQGTSLLVYLPKAEEGAPAAAPESPAVEELPQHGAGRVVLVVDDNELIREMAREVLEASGFRVLVAEGSLEAVRMIENSALPLDLLLTDVVMPGMSGPKLYESLVGRFPRLPVLYISGHTFDLKLHGSVTDGMVHFLPKPFTTDQLLIGIQQALN